MLSFVGRSIFTVWTVRTGVCRGACLFHKAGNKTGRNYGAETLHQPTGPKAASE